jgi:hypothetical protein
MTALGIFLIGKIIYLFLLLLVISTSVYAGYIANTKARIYRRYIAEKELINDFEDFKKSFEYKYKSEL